MDLPQMISIQRKRLEVVEELLKGGARVIDFPGDGFFGFYVDATTSYGLSSAHLENRKRDVGRFLHKKSADVGKKVALEVVHHPETGKRGMVCGKLDSISYLTDGAREHVPYFEILSEENGVEKRTLVRFEDISDMLVGL